MSEYFAAGPDAGDLGGEDNTKGPWTPEEDEVLRTLVVTHGARNWTKIAECIPGRSGKSCRLRWLNQLSPHVRGGPFTPEEDAVILWAHLQYGNKWASISKHLPGRTDNHIKNRWNCTLKKRYGSMLETLRMEMAPGSVTLMDISNLMAQSMPNGGRLSLSAGGVGGIGVSGPLVRWPGQGTTGLGGPGTALGSTTAQLLAVTGSGQLAGLGTGQQMAMGPLALAMAGALGAGGTPPGGGAAGVTLPPGFPAGPTLPPPPRLAIPPVQSGDMSPRRRAFMAAAAAAAAAAADLDQADGARGTKRAWDEAEEEGNDEDASEDGEDSAAMALKQLAMPRGRDIPRGNGSGGADPEGGKDAAHDGVDSTDDEDELDREDAGTDKDADCRKGRGRGRALRQRKGGRGGRSGQPGPMPSPGGGRQANGRSTSNGSRPAAGATSLSPSVTGLKGEFVSQPPPLQAQQGQLVPFQGARASSVSDGVPAEGGDAVAGPSAPAGTSSQTINVGTNGSGLLQISNGYGTILMTLPDNLLQLSSTLRVVLSTGNIPAAQTLVSKLEELAYMVLMQRAAYNLANANPFDAGLDGEAQRQTHPATHSLQLQQQQVNQQQQSQQQQQTQHQQIHQQLMLLQQTQQQSQQQGQTQQQIQQQQQQQQQQHQAALSSIVGSGAVDAQMLAQILLLSQSAMS